jgi:excisionase family DNA binding protein
MLSTITGLIHALPIPERRVYSRQEAASYVGVSAGLFMKLVAQGKMPAPLALGSAKRWDKAAIDEALDALSGRRSGVASIPSNPYDAWKSGDGHSQA